MYNRYRVSPSGGLFLKFKSYYWAIFAAAGAVVLLLALTVVSIVFSGDKSNQQSPHTPEQLQAMQPAADYTPQIEAYQDLLKANPNDTVALMGLGDIYLATEKYSQAADEYNRALAISANDPLIYDRLGQAYFELGMVDVSLNQINKGLAIDPNNQILLFTLGLIYANTGKMAEAKQTLQKAYDIDPASDLAHAARQFISELEKQ